MTDRRVAYFYDQNVGDIFYYHEHPMKPHRIRMTHNLLLNYGLCKKMEIYRPFRASVEQLTRFHSDDYITLLRELTPENKDHLTKLLNINCFDGDCPVFTGLFDFCQISAGGSIAGAMKLNSGECDVAVNWAGGLHHAKKKEPSGFCYVNDIVLGILELLKVHERVLYIDIDVHHGDGVEEAFYTTPRVMTFSLHKYGGGYFPGTGDVNDIGAGPGQYHSVNFPLRDGIDDATYETIFRPIMQTIMERFRPGAIVLQCGADSLAGDRLGTFNLTLTGHGRCVEYVKSFNVPVLMVGGGGYTVRNVSRCWTYETAIMLGEQIPNELPYTEYMEYFSPEFTLQISPYTAFDNLNTREYLNGVTSRILQNLKDAHGTPQISMSNPPPVVPETIDPDEDNAELRMTRLEMDKHRVRDDEFFDTDDVDRAVRDPTSSSRHRVLLTPQELGAGPVPATPVPDLPKLVVAVPQDETKSNSAAPAVESTATAVQPAAQGAVASEQPKVKINTQSIAAAADSKQQTTATKEGSATAKPETTADGGEDSDSAMPTGPAAKRIHLEIPTEKKESVKNDANTETTVEETLQSGSVPVPAEPLPPSQSILRLTVNPEAIKKSANESSSANASATEQKP